MTLLHIDHNGVQTEILSGLKRKPRGKVKRLPSHHLPAYPSTYYPRRPYRRPKPLNDLLTGTAAVLIATAVLGALAL